MKKRSDGRYRKTIKDDRTGKTIYFYGSSEREVNRKLLEYQRKADRGRTFREIADDWYEESHGSWSINTEKTYRRPLEMAISEFGEQYVSDIMPRDIQTMVNRLKVEGYSRSTISIRYIVLHAILDRAVVNGELQVNPCASVKLPKAAKEVRHAAGYEEESLILNTDDKWIFPKLALLTGLRRGEILALKWGDIDFDADLIYVTKGIVYDGTRPIVTTTKTDESVRAVALLTPLKALLNAIKERDNPNDNDFLFSSNGGKAPYTSTDYQREYMRYKRRTGITCTAHQLRHSYATIAIEEGVAAKDLQHALGHASINTTLNIYAEAREKSTRNVGAKMNAAFAEKMGKKA